MIQLLLAVAFDLSCLLSVWDIGNKGNEFAVDHSDDCAEQYRLVVNEEVKSFIVLLVLYDFFAVQLHTKDEDFIL